MLVNLSRKARVSASVGLLVLAATVTAATVTATAQTAPAVRRIAAVQPLADYTPPPVQFSTCALPRLIAAGAQCGTVTVPIDYANPAGPKVGIAIARVVHKSPDGQYQGLMIATDATSRLGLNAATLQSRVPNGGGNDYDWIGVDTRGTGASQPVSCDSHYLDGPRPDYSPARYVNLKAWLNRSTAYTTACMQNNAALITHLSSTDIARDLDNVRVALGQPTVNFYGFGAGAYLGEVYATLFPDKVRKLVLDSPPDPTTVGTQTDLDQAVAQQSNVTEFFAWIARYDNVYHLGTTAGVVANTWYAMRTTLTTAPAGGSIGPAEWTDITALATAGVFDWEGVASALSRWIDDRDASGLLTIYSDAYSGAGDSRYAPQTATRCEDGGWDRDGNSWFARHAAIAGQAPFATWADAWTNAPCVIWPATSNVAVPVNGTNVAPALIISETRDAVAPYSGSLRVRSLFPQARLIEGVNGTTTSSSLQANPCVDAFVSRYLLSGTLPDRSSGSQSDAQCAPTPQPVPTGLR